MNRRSLGIAALAMIPAVAAAEEPVATETSSSPQVARQPSPKPADGGVAPAAGAGGTVEWEGYAFDAESPCTAYVVERTDTLSGGTVGLVFFIPGYAPLGPVAHPATGVFAAAAVGDAYQLGKEGIVNGNG